MDSINKLNTKIFDEDGNLEYVVETGHRTTTVRRYGSHDKDSSEEVGRVDWRLMSPTMVYYGGAQMEKKSFLPRRSALSL